MFLLKTVYKNCAVLSAGKPTQKGRFRSHPALPRSVQFRGRRAHPHGTAGAPLSAAHRLARRLPHGSHHPAAGPPPPAAGLPPPAAGLRLHGRARHPAAGFSLRRLEGPLLRERCPPCAECRLSGGRHPLLEGHCHHEGPRLIGRVHRSGEARHRGSCRRCVIEDQSQSAGGRHRHAGV